MQGMFYFFCWTDLRYSGIPVAFVTIDATKQTNSMLVEK